MIHGIEELASPQEGERAGLGSWRLRSIIISTHIELPHTSRLAMHFFLPFLGNYDVLNYYL